MKDSTDICAHRASHSPQSFLANLHVAGRKHSQRERIYLSLVEHGPATCEEIADRLGMRYTTASARLAELKADRWITPSGQERKTTGRVCASVMRALGAEEREQLLNPKRRYTGRQQEMFA